MRACEHQVFSPSHFCEARKMAGENYTCNIIHNTALVKLTTKIVKYSVSAKKHAGIKFIFNDN